MYHLSPEFSIANKVLQGCGGCGPVDDLPPVPPHDPPHPQGPHPRGHQRRQRVRRAPLPHQPPPPQAPACRQTAAQGHPCQAHRRRRRSTFPRHQHPQEAHQVWNSVGPFLYSSPASPKQAAVQSCCSRNPRPQICRFPSKNCRIWVTWANIPAVLDCRQAGEETIGLVPYIDPPSAPLSLLNHTLHINAEPVNSLVNSLAPPAVPSQSHPPQQG